MGWRIIDWQKWYKARKGREDSEYCHGIAKVMLITEANADYRSLVRGKDGPHCLAGWLAIVCYWARQKNHRWKGGYLWGAKGRAATIEEIAEARFLPVATIKKAISKCLELEWLEQWQPDDSQVAATWQPTASPNDNDNDDDNEKEKDKGKLRVRDYVSLTNAELEKLHAEFGQDMTDRILDKLDNFKGSGGKKYKDDYRAIRNWVIDAVVVKQHDEKKDLLNNVCQDRQAPDYVKEGVARLLGVFAHWKATKEAIDFWVLKFYSYGRWLEEAKTKTLVQRICDAGGYSPDPKVVKDWARGN